MRRCRTFPKSAGLLALMLLTDARRAARTGPSGELIPLEEQDRSTMESRRHRGGDGARLQKTLAWAAVGPYQMQAAIAAVHDEAARPEDTDWAADRRAVRAADADVPQPDGQC